MAHYRVYELNYAGKIMTAEWLEADDDEAAVSRARDLCKPSIPGLEVWGGPRRVALIDCAAEPEEPSG